MIPPIPAQILRVWLSKGHCWDGYEFIIVYPRRHIPGDWRVWKAVTISFTTKANRKGILGDFLREQMRDVQKEISMLLAQGTTRRRK